MTKNNTKTQINNFHPNYHNNKHHWEMSEHLKAGTVAMRKNAHITLPKEPKESHENHAHRVSKSVLFNMYNQTLNNLKRKPFKYSAVFTDPLPSYLDFIFDNINGQGQNLDDFLQKLVSDKLQYGKFIVLVNMPEMPKNISELERINLNLNPFASIISPSSLINWYYRDNELVFAKIAYNVEVFKNGEVEIVNKIDEWTPVYKKTYIEVDGEWLKESENENKLGVVPIIIGNDLNDRPILEDLSWLNLSHFRKLSDLDNILHIACTPFLKFTGWDKDDIEAVVSIHNAYATDNKDAKIDWIEINGNGISKSSDDLEILEARMQSAGASLLVDKKVQTATEKVINTDNNMSILQAVVNDVENNFVLIMDLFNKWLGKNEVINIGLSIYKDFNISQKSVAEIEQLLKMRLSNSISSETFLLEIKRRGIFNDEFEVETELGLLDDNLQFN